MKLTLNNIREQLSKYKTFLLAGLIIIVLLSIVTIQQIILRREIKKRVSPPASQQPVTQGKLDISAPMVQQSQASLIKLKPNLPYGATITTSSGSTVTITAYTKDPDKYDLYVGILGLDFAIPQGDPNYEKTVQDFNDAADNIFEFLTKNNVQPSGIYIVWADSLKDQKTAESWLETRTQTQNKTP